MTRASRPKPRRLLLRLISLLVPAERREEWLEEWEAELAALDAASPSGAGSPANQTPRLGRPPNRVVFVLGAIPHAFWMRKEEWSMDGLMHDLRWASRVLTRSPAFTAVAALTLALGIGVNGTILSLVNGLVLRPPSGIVEPDRLVQVARSYVHDPRWDNWSWPAMEEIERATHVFVDVIGYQGRPFLVGSGVDAEMVSGELVSGNYFSALGLHAVLGRLLEPSDNLTPGGHPVVVLGYDLWQRRFGGDRGVLGEVILLGGQPFEVVGVAPRGYLGIQTLRTSPQLFIPAMMYASEQGMLPFDQWGWSWVEVAARLRAGVTFAAANAAMDGVAQRLREASTANEGIEVLLAQGVGMDPEERAATRQVVLMLGGIAGLVLLLTCANVANLFIARSTSRVGEMGVRIALGAGRGRLARQLATESLLLAMLAAALAVPMVWFAAGYLPMLLPTSVSASLRPDAPVFAALLALGVLVALLFGVGPSIVVPRRSVAVAMRDSASTRATGRTRIRDLLVIGQLAVSLGLLAAATLLGRSVLNASSADPGFNPRGLLVASVDLDLTGRYDDAAAQVFRERLREATLALPGVEAVTLASQAPFLGPFSRAGRVPAERAGDPDAMVEAEAIFVDEHYFRTMEMPLVRGRDFRSAAEEGERVAIVNETLASRFWPGEDAVGKMLEGLAPSRVIGVVADSRNRTLRGSARPAVYEPLSVAHSRRAVLHIRTRGAPLAMARPFRDVVAELDPGLPVTHTADLHAVMAASLGETRTIGVLVFTFAVLAMVLSTIGLYGLVAYGVSKRTREMGIRMALGATPDTLVRLVMGRGLQLVGIGLALGLGLAMLLGRALEAWLYGVSATSPLALASAATLLVGAATVAAWLPARRASRVDAAVSLRE